MVLTRGETNTLDLLFEAQVLNGAVPNKGEPRISEMLSVGQNFMVVTDHTTPSRHGVGLRIVRGCPQN